MNSGMCLCIWILHKSGRINQNNPFSVAFLRHVQVLMIVLEKSMRKGMDPNIKRLY